MNKKILLIVIILILLCAGLFYKFKSEHSVYWKYNDSKIIGHTYDEIIDAYGKFDYIWKPYYCSQNNMFSSYRAFYYIYKEEDMYGNSVKFYYAIYFDENDRAVYVSLQYIP